MMRNRFRIVDFCILAGVVLALATGASLSDAAERKGKKRAAPKKIEKIACKLGTEDHHARIAVRLGDGKVDEFAYYSIWKPRTCSLHVQRGDAYSKWEEFKTVTTVTLNEDTGAVLIDHANDRYKFIFRDVDRMRYCGAEGKVSGSLTIRRGNAQCELDGVMDDDPTKPIEPTRVTDPPEIRDPEAAKKPPDGAGK